MYTLQARGMASAAQGLKDTLEQAKPQEPEGPMPTGFEGLDIVEHNFDFGESLVLRKATNRLVVHHTGTETDRDMSAEEIHRLHRDSFGWAGIGYHYVIRKDGTIERGRSWNTVGAHAGGHNTDSVGISLAGNYEKAMPPSAQLESLIKLLTALCSIYGLMPMETTILGHRDLNATDCPGAYLYSALPQIRRAVHEEMFRETLEDVSWQDEEFE